MNMLPWLIWAATIVIGVFNCYIVCRQIEKTGEPRLGATGKLLKYERKN